MNRIDRLIKEYEQTVQVSKNIGASPEHREDAQLITDALTAYRDREDVVIPSFVLNVIADPSVPPGQVRIIDANGQHQTAARIGVEQADIVRIDGRLHNVAATRRALALFDDARKHLKGWPG